MKEIQHWAIFKLLLTAQRAQAVGKGEEKGGERVRGEGGRERERCVLYDSYRGKKSHGVSLN